MIMIQDADLNVSSHETSMMDYRKTNPALHEMMPAPAPASAPANVSFNPISICYDVISIDEYTEEEMKASWYTANDYLRIRDVARAEVKLLEAGLLVETRIRGLEHRTKVGMRRKKHSRERAYTAVFEEIDFQRDEEIIDEISIAEAYYIQSRSAAVMAQRTAKKDACEAMKIYKKSTKGRVMLNKNMVNKLTVTSSAA